MRTGALARQANTIYAVLVFGYVVSQFFRVSNAVIAPELMQSMAIGPQEIGVVTGVFFLAFAVMQIPTGVLLDRFGPRRTMSGLLVLAAAGSVIFALADGFSGLVAGRALIGVGCAAGLMGAMTAIGRWFPPERFSPMSALLFTVGGAGVLLATTPLALAAELVGWRGAFWIMGGVTLAVAFLLHAVVRDRPPSPDTAPAAEPGAAAESLLEVVRGMGEVVGNRQLWHVCAIQFVSYGATLAVVGLWAGPYLNDVHGLDPVTRGHLLLAVNLAMLAGVMAYSGVERLSGSRKWTISGGAAVSALVLLALAALEAAPLWVATVMLILFALTSAYVMVNHAHARAVLADHVVGRGLTLQNLFVFLGVAVMQAASGAIMGRFELLGGALPEAAYRTLFGFLALVLVAGLALYLPARDARVR